MPSRFIRDPAKPDDAYQAERKREFERWRNAAEIVKRDRRRPPLTMSDEPHPHLRFTDCGLSTRTAATLIKAGIDAPERLLSMAPDKILFIRGIGPTLMKEIEQYRAQFK